MKYLILFLFLFSDLFAQQDTSYELQLMRSKNVYAASSAEIVDSNLATMIPPHLENGWHKWSELNFSTPRLIGKNERIAIIVIGIVPETSDLLICTSLDTQNHNVVKQVFNWGIPDYTHDTKSYGWHYYTINTLIADYTIVSLIWGLGSRPYNNDTVKIDAVYVYFLPAEDTVDSPVDTTVDTTVLLVKRGIQRLPDENVVLSIFDNIGRYVTKMSVKSFAGSNYPDGAYHTSFNNAAFIKSRRGYFWRKQ